MEASKKTLLIIFSIILISVTRVVAADDTPSCASKLTPCANYLKNTTDPPASCCDPIKDAVENDRDCLCNLYNTPGFLQSLGVNITQAIQLTQACGANVGTDLCTAPASPPTGSPAGVPGSDNNAVGRTAYTILSTILLCLASAMFY